MFSKYIKRFGCPCCGYPTLDEKSCYDICILCNWEDDGQDDRNADKVLGGPNGDYSLSEARNNFKLYSIMYRPGNDRRLTGGDTEEEIKIKKELMKVHDSFSENISPSEVRSLNNNIADLEKRLHEITESKILEYEKKIKMKDQ